MSNDTPRTTTDNPFNTVKIRQLMTDHIEDHRHGRHTDTPHPGCAGCLLSGALETEGEGE